MGKTEEVTQETIHEKAATEKEKEFDDAPGATTMTEAMMVGVLTKTVASKGKAPATPDLPFKEPTPGTETGTPTDPGLSPRSTDLAGCSAEPMADAERGRRKAEDPRCTTRGGSRRGRGR